jgi:hypothetical protein
MELGQTDDKTQLVPGRVSAVRANVDNLADEATRIQGKLQTFRGVRVPHWQGGTSGVFRLRVSEETKKWEAYLGLLNQATGALSTYADALGTAQDKAQDAIDKWNEGERVTAAAVTEYNAAVARYNTSLLQPAGSPFAPLQSVPHPGAFHDPGEALRQEAQRILDDAREQLDSAGSTALDALGAPEQAGGSRNSSDGDVDVFGADGDLEGPEFSWTGWEHVFGSRSLEDTGESPFEITLGTAEGEIYVFNAEGEFTNYYGNVKVNGDGSVTVLGADGSAEATIDKEGVRVGADGRVTILGAEGTIHGELGPAEAELHGEAFVGAEGGGGITLGSNGVHADGELFAGARARAEAAVDVGGIGAEGAVEGQAGIGVSAGGGVEVEDGKITIEAEFGAALGLGGKVEGGITVDPGEVYESGQDAVEWVGGLFS